ncbi:Glyoxalase/Bleomycin resistance protein/Dihydroxybiphenyl dioxygenase [Cladorrhinum sp. PSN259]|nr:Glyoxalase/Bleomycin resistance protein/Dihydroxybiphenyl dioxygenase [Cladorrhinum sp. PSN259]
MALSKLQLTTCLWFDGQAEQAANFYVSIFKNSRITHVQRYSDAGKEYHGHEAGDVLIAEFELDGHRFVGLNGGPEPRFNHAVSFMIDCATQEEVDYYWDKLGEGGDDKAKQCGWLSDKYGVSWQVVPTVLKQMMSDPDKEKADRATVAMMHMTKLDIAGLQKAFDGEK